MSVVICAGGSLHIPSNELRLQPDKLKTWLQETRITGMLNAVPHMWGHRQRNEIMACFSGKKLYTGNVASRIFCLSWRSGLQLTQG
jgi:hypothetical protein